MLVGGTIPVRRLRSPVWAAATEYPARRGVEPNVQPSFNSNPPLVISSEQEVGNGVDVGVSSWRRMAPGTLPAGAKIGGQYVNSQFMVMEAAEHGYAEAIALDASGLVSEGSGANLFLVNDGVLVTPPLATSILPGITRECVLTLAREMGIPVREEPIAREFLYLADEAFFTGTATEISAIRSIDHIAIGEGKRGPMTERLQREFFGLTDGTIPDRHGWLTPVA